MISNLSGVIVHSFEQATISQSFIFGATGMKPMLRENKQADKRSATLDRSQHPFRFRALTPADLHSVIDVHHRVLESLPNRDILRPDDDQFILEHLGEKGCTLGAFDGDQLVAYARLTFPVPEKDSMADLIPIMAEERAAIAHFDGSGVLPAYRQKRIHKKMNAARERHALSMGLYHLIATVSPKNIPCLKSLLLEGFTIVNAGLKYGGLERLIVHRDGRNPKGLEIVLGSAPTMVPLTDFNGIKAMLRTGRRGLGLHENDGETVVVFGPSQE